ncbi:MAG: hypothetical protein M1826_000389 [Phylliscum demangeonii]|nr:MAG: hypothetical protein M1826_000389 [Phylliscum demangeonii]
MAFGSQRLHTLGAPLLLLLFSLMALGSAAPFFENWQNWHPLRQINSFLHPTRLPFQGRGRIQVLAQQPQGFQPAGYISYEGVWVNGLVPDDVGEFDGKRSGKGNYVTVRTTRHSQCGVADSPSPPVMACSDIHILGPNPAPIGPIVNDRIQAWAVFTPFEAEIMPSSMDGPTKAFITFTPIDVYKHSLQLKWVPV